MMRDLLDIATQYATGEEAILANFDGKTKAACTSVVVMATATLLHLGDTATGGRRIESATKRRWWLWPTAPPSLSPTYAALDQNNSRRRLRLPVPFMGGCQASL
jgi:hypothetical protein